MGLFGPPNVGRMKAKGDVRGLIEALSYRKDAAIRKSAADALVGIGVPAVAPLSDALKHEDSAVRLAAADALGRIGNADAVAPLLLAREDRETSVREAASAALVGIGRPAAERCIALLGDSSGDLRAKAARALALVVTKLEDSALRARAIDLLLAALNDNPTFGGGLDSALEQVFTDLEDPAVRARAVEGIADAMDSGDVRVRRVATIALARVVVRLEDAAVRARATEPLVAALRAAADRVQAAGGTEGLSALRELSAGGSREAGDQMLAMVQDGILLRFAMEPLTAALTAGDDAVRQAAACVLGEIGLPGFVLEPLVAALKDRHSGVREAAAAALFAMGWRE